MALMTVQEVINWINTNFAGELKAKPRCGSAGILSGISWASEIEVTGNNGVSVGVAPMGIAHPLDRGDGEERVKVMFRADMESALLLPRTILHKFVGRDSRTLEGLCSVCGEPFYSYCHASPEHKLKSLEQIANEYYKDRT